MDPGVTLYSSMNCMHDDGPTDKKKTCISQV